MVRIVLDEVDGLFQADADDPLGEVLAGIESYLASAGRVLSSVRVDGKELGPPEQVLLERSPVSSFAKVELESITAAALALDTLVEVKEHLPRLIQGLRRAARLSQAGRFPEAAAAFTDACEVWVTLLSAMEKATAVLGTGAERLRPRLDEVSALFVKGRDAVAAADSAALADIAAFELAPRVASLLEGLRELACEMKRRFAAGDGG